MWEVEALVPLAKAATPERYCSAHIAVLREYALCGLTRTPHLGAVLNYEDVRSLSQVRVQTGVRAIQF